MTAKEELAAYLSGQKWTSFFTATFATRQRYSAKAIDLVQAKLYEPRLRPTKAFIAAEQHLLGGWHCHGLLEYPDRKDAGLLNQCARNSLDHLGFNRISVVNNNEAASIYLAKYLLKDDNHGDWRMLGRKKFWQTT